MVVGPRVSACSDHVPCMESLALVTAGAASPLSPEQRLVLSMNLAHRPPGVFGWPSGPEQALVLVTLRFKWPFRASRWYRRRAVPRTGACSGPCGVDDMALLACALLGRQGGCEEGREVVRIVTKRGKRRTYHAKWGRLLAISC